MHGATVARPFTRTTNGDFLDHTAGGAKPVLNVLGARLTAAAAAASCDITDADGTILYKMAAPIGVTDESCLAVAALGKVSVANIAGAGASVTVYLE